jgi:cation diffusion facilitator CzcD-associated flavoprotein CzcO
MGSMTKPFNAVAGGRGGSSPLEEHSVVIIGAGFGGIGMAIRLKRAGIHDFVLLEKAADLGGTWRDNTYPGATCDIPSHLYSFSFEPKTDWSRKYPAQREILDYLRQCVRRHGLRPHLRFGAEVSEARFDEDAGLWRITTDDSEFATRVLVPACGQLSSPAYPDIEGRDTFQGPSFHSARWDHRCDLAGKRVAVIGTGASAIQFVPPVAERAERLSLFQRSAPYVIEKPDRPYARWEQALFTALPGVQALSRAKAYLQYESRALGFVRFPKLMDLYGQMFRRQLAESIADPHLRAALTPRYPMGCKRILISNDFYPAVTRSNVDIVTDPIERIGPHEVITRNGTEHEADVIIYGTGFQANDFLAPMKIVGRNERDLNEAWRDGAEAYLGILVSGFPNLFLLYGPNTNLGHNSILYMLESQFRYILGCLRAIRRHSVRWIDVRPDVQHGFNRDMQRRFRNTIWDQGCTSWYKTADGRIVNNWPGFTFAYRRATRRPDPRDFEIRI